MRSLFIHLMLFSFCVFVCFGQNYTTYRVPKRATIETVAFLNDVTPEDILRANPTINPNEKLKQGQIVRIPIKTEVKKEQPQNVTVQKENEKVAEVITTPKPAPVSVSTSTEISFDSSQTSINIVALLPFEIQNLSQSMVELYSGMVMAVADLKEECEKEISLKVYSTEDLTDTYLDKILSDADCIVGPVDEDKFKLIAAWAFEHKKPLVSPLKEFEISGNPYVINMPPVKGAKNDPLKNYLTSEKNIVLIEHSQYNNKTLSEEFISVAPFAKKMSYDRETVTPVEIAQCMDSSKQNVFLIPTDQQGAIEDVVSKVVAVNSPVKTYNISIVGSSSWQNLSNVSPLLLFRGNVSCVSSYYFDRDDKVVSTIFKDYVNAFERIPSKFAMRGYDIVDIMVNSLTKWDRKLIEKLDGSEFIPLQTPYHFVKDSSTQNIQNVHWLLLSFNENYSVTIK